MLFRSRGAARPPVVPGRAGSAPGRVCAMSAPHRTSDTAPQEQARWRRRTLGALNGTVLDVGAGSGTSGRFLAPGAFKKMGLEINKYLDSK